MATPRLPFLYPQFLRAVRSCKPTTHGSIRARPRKQATSRRYLHSTPARAQESSYQQRYGPAASPSLPPPPKPSEPLTPRKELEARKEELRNEELSDEAKRENQQEVNATEQASDKQAVPEQTESPESKQSEDAPESRPEETGDPLPNKELDMVLSIPSPSEIKGESQKHPHLEASPYEHHFDTYTLVQQLAGTGNGYTEEQAVTLMKAIRLMLAVNLDIAKEGLVSKSDVENETYLFRAACSELRTTLQTGRHAETQRQRGSRAQLQHEYDILNQKVTQDLASMREDLKGMFNDRKLSLQEEKRKIDGKISELNYEITVLLNSDSKSEVEGLRWVLTRRAALAIAIAAFMVLASLKASSSQVREREDAEKKKKAAMAAVDERASADPRYTTPSRAQGTQTDSSTSTQNYEESLG